ncbi:hypothetical protein [Acetivibrio saccincola]|jgi:hypothetical protein|uniref:Uncharacterized protein n=1 Tax=Acetivibrio saccincola TaxID=1677857 RepID=A0A2K9ELA8_9FIRM|nr:hypothetical protein [Acetivibrio saccincola]AUG56220.1 hypothetical protein HVS_01260 [Acetivibrio saccincola]NLW27466.1 hypothetical protein [Acetivibrio saccincola]PQQ65594.1 hypothetical protein B9R14_01630 [Acetivibrio saccincola]HOA97258.1 hypothetical protein [Acetivibrio saccincola]HQD28120.1 hypothetical protein [Acetivibrio saccincola]
MIIDTGITLAYKCSSCGTFQFNTVSLFEIPQKEDIVFTCRCRGASLVIRKESPTVFKIMVPCIGCGTSHVYLMSTKEFIAQEIYTFNCPNTGIKQCFIGSDKIVRKKIDSLEREYDELIDRLGYDNYFANTQVMLDSLNLIHDIAERGNLFCECGSNDIELFLFSDKIYLKCNLCPGSKIIYASSNEHLKVNLLRKEIMLINDGQPADIKIEPATVKRDGRIL